MVSLEEAEMEFWRLMTSEDTDIVVEYGADLSASEFGSGFPSQHNSVHCASDKYFHSPWNLNNIPLGKHSALQFLTKDISGMITPWCYVGMIFSCFCWHTEDHWSYSINYLHKGSPKTWYGVPTAAADTFEAAMRAEIPELFETSPDLLHHMTTMVSPTVLINRGVPVYRLDQLAGEFVITFPRAYHAGFNQGFNFAEAVNFCPADWFDMGQSCIEYYAISHRAPVFSHAELLCRMAQSNEPLSVEFLVVVIKQLKELLTTERSLRRLLARVGVRRTERVVFEETEDDKRECDLCHTLLYLSALACRCSSTMVCLAHHQARNCCPREEQVMRYRYDLDELSESIAKLEAHLDDYHQWRTTIESAVQLPITGSIASDTTSSNSTQTHMQSTCLDKVELSDGSTYLKSLDRNGAPDSNQLPASQQESECNVVANSNSLSLVELHELLNIGKSRNYPTSDLDRLKHFVAVVDECSSVVRGLLCAYRRASSHAELSPTRSCPSARCNVLDTRSTSSLSDSDSYTDGSDDHTDSCSDDSYLTEHKPSKVSTGSASDVMIASPRKSPGGSAFSTPYKSAHTTPGNKCNVQSPPPIVGATSNERKSESLIVSKLRLDEFFSLVRLVSKLNSFIPDSSEFHDLANRISTWRDQVRHIVYECEQVSDAPSLDEAQECLTKSIHYDLPHLRTVGDLLRFPSTILVDLPETTQLNRIYECLSWCTLVQNALESRSISTTAGSVSQPLQHSRPSLDDLCTLQLQGDFLSSNIAYLGIKIESPELGGCMRRIPNIPRNRLDHTLMRISLRLLNVIQVTKDAEEKLLRIKKASPGSVLLEEALEQLRQTENLPAALPIAEEVRKMCTQAQTVASQLEMIEKLLVKIPPSHAIPSIDQQIFNSDLCERLALGTVDCVPTTWKSYVDELLEQKENLPIYCPQIARVRTLIKYIDECRNRMERLFLWPNSKLSLLEILLPRSNRSLDLLVCLDSGKDIDSFIAGSSSRRSSRLATAGMAAYASFCLENAKMFAKAVVSCTDPTVLYDAMYRQLMTAESTSMHRLRRSNMLKSRLKNQRTVTYCICRKPGFSGFMVQCELCRDWFHERCVFLPSMKESEAERFRYMCPRCERGLRPDLATVFKLLDDLNSMVPSHSQAVPTSTVARNRRPFCLAQLPEFAALQMLCERALAFIRLVRSTLQSSPELSQMVSKYEQYVGAKMPLDYTESMKQTSAPCTGPTDRALQRVQRLEHAASSTAEPYPSRSVPRAGSFKETKCIRPPGPFHESDPVSSARRHARKTPLTIHDIPTGRGPENWCDEQRVGAAEALAEMSASLSDQPSIGSPPYSSEYTPFHDSPRPMWSLHSQAERRVLSGQERSLVQCKQAARSPTCMPIRVRTDVGRYESADRPSSSHGRSSLTSHCKPSPHARYDSDELDTTFLPSSHISSRHGEKYFYHHLSPESRTTLEMLIMKANLLEVDVPQTRWLWQLHLASDPENTTNGATKPQLARIEENRLKRRFIKQLEHARGSRKSFSGKRRRVLLSEQASMKTEESAAFSSAMHEDDKVSSESSSYADNETTEFDQRTWPSVHSKPIPGSANGTVHTHRKVYRPISAKSSLVRRYMASRTDRLQPVRRRPPFHRLNRVNRGMSSISAPAPSQLRYRLGAKIFPKRILSSSQQTLPRRMDISGRKPLQIAGQGRGAYRRPRRVHGTDSSPHNQTISHLSDVCSSTGDENESNEDNLDEHQPSFRNVPGLHAPRRRGKAATSSRVSQSGQGAKSTKRKSSAQGGRAIRKDECHAEPCQDPRTGTVEWIACDRCNLWYHQVCVGIRHKNQIPKVYICPNCPTSSRTSLSIKHTQRPGSRTAHRSLDPTKSSHEQSEMRVREFPQHRSYLGGNFPQRPIGWSYVGRPVGFDSSSRSTPDDLSGDLGHPANPYDGDPWLDYSSSSGTGEPDAVVPDQPVSTSNGSAPSADILRSTTPPLTPNPLRATAVDFGPKDPTEVLLEAIEVVSGSTSSQPPSVATEPSK
ncbi:unnamed protein product [Dicrocoelium dendriticum]|nr:unnamed protein product [Dicrocoelium dendriticum]